MKKTKNRLCVVDNKLIEGRFRLSRVECRLIMHTIARIHQDDEAFKTYEYHASELIEILGLGAKNKGYLVDVIRELSTKTVEIREDDGLVIANWLGGETVIYDDGRITIRFGEKLKPYLIQLSRKFTPLQLESMMSFRSTHAMRIYMLCKQYEISKTRKVSIDELKQYLNLENEYKRFADFQQYVLEPAKREINELSDIRIKIEPDTTTRLRKAYRNLIFTIKPAQPSQSTPKTLKEPSKPSQSDLEALKAQEDNERYEKTMLPLRKAYSELSEAERLPFESQYSLFDLSGDATVIAWAKSAGLWQD
jgi:plasmid replication initiation protein